MDVHQAADPKALASAIRAGMPFGRTSCGVTAPRSELTIDPNQVGCGLCNDVNGVLVAPAGADRTASPASTDDLGTASAGWQQAKLSSQDTDGAPDVGSPGEFGDLDDDLDGFNPDGDDWALDASDLVEDAGDTTRSGDDGPKEVVEEEPDVFFLVGETLGGLVPDGYEPVDVWSRWMIDPSDDPDGPLLLSANRKVDLRQFIPLEDLKFIGDLGQIASMFGAESVASQMASIVHRLTSMAQAAGAKPLWKPKKVSAKAAPKADPKTAPKVDSKAAPKVDPKTVDAKSADEDASAKASALEDAPADGGGAGAEA